MKKEQPNEYSGCSFLLFIRVDVNRSEEANNEFYYSS